MSGFVHECDWCGESKPCSRLDWEACEGRGVPWFCSRDCADKCDGQLAAGQESEDDPRDFR